MRRALKWIGIGLLVLILLPVIALAAVIGLANLDVGRRFIESETASLTGGMVRIEGLHGRFPETLLIDRVQVADSQGVYVTISDLVLDWSPTKLLRKVAEVDDLTADTIAVARLPVSESKTTRKSQGNFNLPVQVDLRRLMVKRLEIAPPVAGVGATLAIEGSGHLETLTQGQVALTVSRLDSPGQYQLAANAGPQQVKATLSVSEPPKGLIASIAKLPDLGAIDLKAAVDGPMDALATKLALSAGPLTASADGTVDANHQAANLSLQAHAPAMEPAPGVSWQSVLVDAKVTGPFAAPDASGTVRLDGLAAAGARIGALAADVKGNKGHIDLHTTVGDLHIPGPKPDLLASDPIVLDASAELQAPDRPATFALRHPLLQLTGSANLGSQQSVRAHLVTPDLAPLAAAGGADVQGRAELDLQASKTAQETQAAVDGVVGITGGKAPLPALVGPDAHIALAASMRGQDITLSNLSVNGKAVTLSAKGGMADRKLNLDFATGLSDLAAIEPSISGTLDVRGHAAGPADDVALQADIDTDLASSGYRSGHVTAHVDATGLPNAPKAAVNASGTLLDAPVTLALTAERSDGAIKANISQLAWKSLQADGHADLAQGATIPSGRLHLGFSRLADLQPLLHKPLAGSLAADLDADEQAAHLDVKLDGVAAPGTASISKAALAAVITHPTDHPAIDGTLTADGVAASSVHGLSARVTAKGPIDAVALTADAKAPDLAGGPVRLTTAATLNGEQKSVALARLEAGWKDQVLRLLAPARIGFANGVSIDRLRLGFRQAELMVAGKVGQTLDLTAKLRNLPADVAAIASPSLAADGVISADARITGTSAEPQGKIHLAADRVKLRSGPGQSLPAANLKTDITLMGKSARIDTALNAGPSRLGVNGTAGLAANGPINLRTEGRIDLTMLDPLLSAEGRRARGVVTLNASATGTAAAPRINGTAELVNGDVVDYAQGAHVSNLSALIQATGDTIRLSRFTGRAGPGTLGGSGTIGLGGAMPIDLHFTADNARPLASDLLTALIDANLSVTGEVKGDMQAAGTLHVRRADIRVPDKMPPSIAVLPVRRADAPPAPPPAPSATSNIALNLTLDAPQQVFIRGRGLDAELGGRIHIHGTAANPQPDGGLHLRRGTLSVVGTTLNFTEGTITFTGAGISDPSVHFVATSQTSAITAMLTVSGSAKDPKITLSSVPDLPQDEILAQLLFNTSTSKLSPLQLAQIASALASLSGAGGGFDPLDRLRNVFGLDRLSVGSSAAGNPTVEAGRYVARGVYVGAKQSTSGGGPQATVQVDLAKGLKLETTAGSNTTNATGASSSADAASVGLTYQFEY